MKKEKDCLLIGHNDMDFTKYEQTIRQMGTEFGTYRDLNLNFLRYKDKPYHASEIFNLFCRNNNLSHPSLKNMSYAFSATLAYLGTYLYKKGFSFDYILSFQDEKDELSRKLRQENILTIAITTTYYISAFPIIEIVEFIKRNNQTAKIIVGGPFIFTQCRSQEPGALEILFKLIDADFYVNSAHGERALTGIIDSLKSGLPVKHINNIYYKSGTDYISTPILEENNKLSVNMVNWDLFSDRVDKYVNVRTAISCPFSCAFCGSPEHAGAYQAAPVDKIEKELNQLNKIDSVEIVHFIEDTFNFPPKRFKEILRMMIKNKYRFTWHSYFRAQFAEREMIELMKESRCEGVYLGLESGNNQILKNMNKIATVEKYYEGIALLKEYGILTHGNFIIGFPGETSDTVRDTIIFIKESGIDFYRVQLWYCMPITPIWKERDKYNIIGNSFEWSHKTMDSKTACDLIESIFLSIDEPIWLPQYNFDINNLLNLLHHGMSLEKLKNFLKGFNNGLKEKLINPDQKEISSEVVRQLENACQAAADWLRQIHPAQKEY